MFVLYNSRLTVVGIWFVRTSEVVVLSTFNIESLFTSYTYTNILVQVVFEYKIIFNSDYLNNIMHLLFVMD
jgi:hypothetical protein